MAESERGDQQPQMLIIKRIESAPIQRSQSWGPALLGPGLDWDWVIGEWDGDGWSTLDGWRIAPQYYSELPLIPVRGPPLYFAQDLRDQPDRIESSGDL